MTRETSLAVWPDASQYQSRSRGFSGRRTGSVPLGVRVMACVTPEPNTGCWLWTGNLHGNGYGLVSHKKKTIGAHRAAWLAFRGAIPSGLWVLHRCDHPPCVNPDHLFLGTHAENEKDKIQKGRQARGERQHLARLTAAAALDIRERRANGATYEALAIAHQITPTAIMHVAMGRTWKHVGGPLTPVARITPPRPSWKARALRAEAELASLRRSLALAPAEELELMRVGA